MWTVSSTSGASSLYKTDKTVVKLPDLRHKSMPAPPQRAQLTVGGGPALGSPTARRERDDGRRGAGARRRWCLRDRVDDRSADRARRGRPGRRGGRLRVHDRGSKLAIS